MSAYRLLANHAATVCADDMARWTRGSGATVTHDAGVVGEPMVAVHHLTKIYEPRRRWLRGPRAPVRAVSDVDLAAARGRTLAIVGESGCRSEERRVGKECGSL